MVAELRVDSMLESQGLHRADVLDGLESNLQSFLSHNLVARHTFPLFSISFSASFAFLVTYLILADWSSAAIENTTMTCEEVGKRRGDLTGTAISHPK